MKTVNLPITVPSGSYCWEYSGKREICEYFDYESGHPKCLLHLYPQTPTEKGVPKDIRCNSLKSI